MKKSVRLTEEQREAVSFRDWGIPHLFVGKCWRGRHHPKGEKMAMCLPCPTDTSKMIVQTRWLEVVEDPADAWIPQLWERAMLAYAQQWPHSSDHVLHFIDLPAALRLRAARERITGLLELSFKDPATARDEIVYIQQNLCRTLRWMGGEPEPWGDSGPEPVFDPANNPS